LNAIAADLALTIQTNTKSSFMAKKDQKLLSCNLPIKSDLLNSSTVFMPNTKPIIANGNAKMV
ncbi:MAG TPA: hypothetical protein PLH33_09080, partial [Chitinophagaceae bacterium]|nr:hypothetical protein [Chitinophagaceae bacterium]